MTSGINHLNVRRFVPAERGGILYHCYAFLHCYNATDVGYTVFLCVYIYRESACAAIRKAWYSYSIFAARSIFQSVTLRYYVI